MFIFFAIGLYLSTRLISFVFFGFCDSDVQTSGFHHCPLPAANLSINASLDLGRGGVFISPLHYLLVLDVIAWPPVPPWLGGLAFVPQSCSPGGTNVSRERLLVTLRHGGLMARAKFVTTHLKQAWMGFFVAEQTPVERWRTYFHWDDL